MDRLEHLESRDIVGGWPPEILEELAGSGLPATASMVVASEGHPDEVVERVRQLTGEFHAADGLLVAGSDAGMPGVGFGEGLHRELALLVEIGMTPTETLQAATSRAAPVLDEPGLGAIREGTLTDLVAVEGRPHEDIRDAAEIRLVLRDGRPVVDGRE